MHSHLPGPGSRPSNEILNDSMLGSTPYGLHEATNRPTVYQHTRRTQTIKMTTESSRTTEGQGKLFNSVLDTMGDTPCIRINRLAPDNVRLYVKAEFFNPAASVKDRLAVSIIEEAERSGELKPGQTVVEATSGNTGIGLAMVCAAKGYPLVVTMADSFSVERRKLMRYLGAKVVLTPRAEKGFGMVEKAADLAKANGWFLARQFESKANALIHENTTAREIMSDFDGQRLDYFVTGWGTGGTVTGVGRVLRKERPDTKIILCEPNNAQVIGCERAQARNEDGSPAESHTAFEPHPIQGWAPDFVPLVVQEAIDNKYFDEIVTVTGEEGVAGAHQLAKSEGIMTGISGGATFAAALKIAERAEGEPVIVCMLPDTSERYLSSPLFASIEEVMTEEEIALSLSTPGYHMPKD
jgi:cysteine synthase A